MISLRCPTFFSLWAQFEQKLAATSKVIEKNFRTVFVSHV